MTSPTVYEDKGMKWSPQNYDRSFGGPTTLYRGLIMSRNIVAVKLLDMVGVETVIDYAHRMGIKSHLGNNLSLALGTSEVCPLEMAAAFAHFPQSGRKGRTDVFHPHRGSGRQCNQALSSDQGEGDQSGDSLCRSGHDARSGPTGHGQECGRP